MEKKDQTLEAQKRILEEFFPFEKLPVGVKQSTFEYLAFRKELTKESDRGCALLAASHLDYMLEKVLRQKLCGSKNHLDSLFAVNAPLATFSGKILIAYSLGLISKSAVSDIQIIRKIRNKFGHSPSIISFDDDQIQVLCTKLVLIANPYVASPREKFVTSVSYLSGDLEGLLLTEKKFEEAKEENIEERKSSVQGIMKLLDDFLK